MTVGPNHSRAGASDRHQRVLCAIRAAPAPLTEEALHLALHLHMTRLQVRSALACLRDKGLVKIARLDPGHRSPSTWTLA